MFVISQLDKELYKANTNESAAQTNPTFNSRLKKIKDYRNDIAHRPIDYESLSGGTEGVGIRKRAFKKANPISISESRVQEHINDCTKITNELNHFLSKSIVNKKS